MSDPLQSRGLWYPRLFCPPLFPRACSNSCPLRWWCYLIISSSIAPFNLSQPQDLSELALLIRWPKYWSSSISPSNEYSGLISFRINWFDLLAVQRTPKSLLLHHSSKASLLGCSAFFQVQLLHPYLTNGKTRALTIRTFLGKVMSLLFILSEKAMAPHSSTLAWKIPWTEELVGCSPWGR